MYRRRLRPRREVVFSFDSFLDVVANVIGIIVRLILVAWVGARSYDAAMQLIPPQQTPEIPAVRPEENPLYPQLLKIRSNLNAARTALAEQTPKLSKLQTDAAALMQQIQQVAKKTSVANNEVRTLASLIESETKQTQEVGISIQSLEERSRLLAKEAEAAKQTPIKKTTLTYRVPVSKPVVAEELHFECKSGKVAFVDLAGFVAEIKAMLPAKAERLKTQWQVTETTATLGGFRLRYTVERERGALDGLVTGGVPNGDTNFRYGVSGWVAERVSNSIGEAAEVALRDKSAFRTVADAADKHTVVTFWVYPDSFETFRRLRDYLQQRGVEVAGRPLPEGVPIAASKYGTASRGQ